MSDGLRNLDAKIAKIEQATEAMREATRDGHEMIQTLKLLKRELSELLDQIDVAAKKRVDDYLEEAVAAGLDDYSETIQNAMRAAVSHVEKEFDKLGKLFMGEDDERGSLESLIRKGKRLD
jgi:predicted transcriptional regulator